MIAIPIFILSDFESPEVVAEGVGVGNNELDVEENEECNGCDCGEVYVLVIAGTR